MSEVIGGIFTSHVPGIGNAIAKGLQQDPYWKPFFDGFPPIHRLARAQEAGCRSGVLQRSRAQLLPRQDADLRDRRRSRNTAMRMKAGASPSTSPIPGFPELSWHIIEDGGGKRVRSGDVPGDAGRSRRGRAVTNCCGRRCRGIRRSSSCRSRSTRCSTRCPARSAASSSAARSAGRSRPGPATRRSSCSAPAGCRTSSKASVRASSTRNTTTSASTISGPNPEALLQHDSLDIVELAGSQGVEILNWLAARGAMLDDVVELEANYHVPISNTAAATHAVRKPGQACQPDPASPIDRSQGPVPQSSYRNERYKGEDSMVHFPPEPLYAGRAEAGPPGRRYRRS